MSLDELYIKIETGEIELELEIPEIEVGLDIDPEITVLASGNIGPQGPPGLQGIWVSLTQAEYDALDPPDPEILYVIVE